MCALLGSQAGENQEGALRPEWTMFDRNSGPGARRADRTGRSAVQCGLCVPGLDGLQPALVQIAIWIQGHRSAARRDCLPLGD